MNIESEHFLTSCRPLTVTYCSDANQSDHVGPLDLFKNLFVQLSDFWPVMIGSTALHTAAVLPSRLYLLSVKTLGSVCPGALTTPSAPEALTEKSVDSGEITSGERRAVREMLACGGAESD